MRNKVYMTAQDISNVLGVSRSKSYQIIKKLNDELQKEGYLIISGKVSLKYFEEKYYGLTMK